MSTLRIGLGVGLGLGAMLVAAACAEDRSGFRPEPPPFEPDAAVSDDASACQVQCSLDGRSVISGCTGEIVETCQPELACGGGKCQEPCAAAAADRTSNGCEFYFQPPRFEKTYQRSCFAAFLVNASTQPVDVTLALDGKALDISRSIYRTQPGEASLIPHEGPIAPGDSAILFVADREPDAPSGPVETFDLIRCPKGVVAATYADTLPDGTGIGSSFHLKTSLPIGASTIYPFGGAASLLSAATLLLPVTTWSKEHILIDGWSRSVAGVPGAQIVASEDDTEVTVDPVGDIQDGVGVKGTAARVPATYRLDKGQVLQLVQAVELTGSIVTSTKETTIFGGNSCAFVPSFAEACDYLHQQIPAFAHWGSEYVGVGYRPRLGNEHEPVPYRIVAARDGTLLEYDPAIPPGAPVSLNAGEMATFVSGTGDAFVVRTQDAEHPIYLAAYMTGGNSDFYGTSTFSGRGDPEFVNVVPVGQYSSSYSFYADPTYAETSLVVVRKKHGGAFKDVWLECAGDLTGFRPVGTSGEYEFMRVDLSRGRGPGDAFDGGVCRSGLQRMRSEGPFTATLWGWDTFASYAYPGGSAQRKLVAAPLAPIH